MAATPGIDDPHPYPRLLLRAPPRWALVMLLLAGAVAAQAVPWLTGAASPAWELVLAPLSGLLVLGALLVAPAAGRHEDQLFQVAALLFGPVDRFRASRLAEQEREERRRAAELERQERERRDLRHNTELVANLTGVLRAYRLPDLDRHCIDDLVRNPSGGGRLRVAQLADEAATILATAPDLPDPLRDRGVMAASLTVLYADQFGGPEAHQAAARAWSAHRDALATTLPTLVTRHDLLAGGDDWDPTEIGGALRDMPRFDLGALAKRLRQAPRVVVDNMVNVLDTYDLGSLPGGAAAEIENKLSGTPYVQVAHACAVHVARRLPGVAERDVDRKARLIELLYRERFARPTIRLWSSHKGELIVDLVPALTRSHHLSKAPVGLDTVLGALDDFNLRLTEAVVVRLGALWDLATGFATYLTANGVPADLAPADLLEHVKGSLPATAAELFALEARHVDLDLLCSLGKRWIAEAAPRASQADRAAVALAAAGSYLTRASQRPDLAVDLARLAGLADIKDRVAAVLLALLWKRQVEANGGEAHLVPLGELARSWRRSWRPRAKTDLGERLYAQLHASIGAELRRGEWPARLPAESALVELAEQGERIIKALAQVTGRSVTAAELKKSLAELQLRLTDGMLPPELAAAVDAGRVGDVEKALQGAFTAVQNEIGALRTNWGEEIAGSIRDLADRIASLDPATPTRVIEKALRDVKAEARDEARAAFEEASAAPLTRLAEQVDALSASEREMAEALHNMELWLGGDITRSRVYVMTFDARTGPLAMLVDHLKTQGYRFVHYTPYARIGLMPEGMGFDAFHRQFVKDLAGVLRDRRKILPGWDFDEQDLSNVEVTLQLIARALRENFHPDGLDVEIRTPDSILALEALAG